MNMNTKADYLHHLEQEIAEAESALQALKAEYQQTKEAAQHEEIEKLEQHLQSARIRSQDLSQVTEEAWLDLKAMIEEAVHNLRESLQKLLKRQSK